MSPYTTHQRVSPSVHKVDHGLLPSRYPKCRSLLPNLRAIEPIHALQVISRTGLFLHMADHQLVLPCWVKLIETERVRLHRRPSVQRKAEKNETLQFAQRLLIYIYIYINKYNLKSKLTFSEKSKEHVPKE